MKRMKSETPKGKSKYSQKVKPISPQTVELVKKIKKIIIIGGIIGTIQGGLYLYNNKQRKTWEI
jgi:hypothetical protein